MPIAKKKFYPTNLAEVLILQKFPYGQDSIFLYFYNEKKLRLSVGDIVSVPFRKAIKNGVVVKISATKINLEPQSEYFNYLSPSNRKIKLRPINSLIEKKFLSADLLENLRLLALEHCVSWNHFVTSVVNLAPLRKTAYPKILPIIGSWCQAIKNNSEELPQKIPSISFSQKNVNSYIFMPPDKPIQLISLLWQNFKQQKQTLVLVPERNQLLPEASKYAYFSAKFSNSTPVILGKFLPRNAFLAAWQLSRTTAPQIFIGTRSAIFAPFSKLGLIIVEDGHDGSHKQWDMAPLYDVRDILSKIYPKVFKIYISATPRLHDFYNSPRYLKANNSKLEIATINLANLKPTPPAAPISTNEEPPFLLKKSCTYEGEKKEITLVNMAQERNFSKEPAVLSTYLRKQIVNSLKKGKWAVIVASHKNFANFIACKECGFIPSCPHCGKYLNIRLKALFHCNFCGKNLPTLDYCPKCSGNNFVLLNFGIESIKEKLVELKKKIDFKLIIPPDPDSGSRYLYSFWKELIAYQRKPVILLGLSGILSLAKLLKKNIALAASTSFDNILFHSDYRCEEKAAILYYNLLKVTEKVIIQTRDPAQSFFQKVLAKPYSALFSDWIQERKDYNYPPFSDLLKLNIAASNPYHQKTILENLRRKLSLKREVLEVLTILPKITPGKNNFIVSVLLKLRRGTETDKLLSNIYREFGHIKADPDPETLI